MARVLVTGGAGYIGSVCCEVLRREGHQVVVYDDFSTGHRWAVRGECVEGDVREGGALDAVFARWDFDAVMHFAAKALVGESVEQPGLYFDVNVGGTVAVLAAMRRAGVHCFVFSGSCSIYGDPQWVPVTEDHPRNPVSPYGQSKKLCEDILDASRGKEGLRATSLRYFNAAGAMVEAGLGEVHDPETHLIPLAVQAALGKRGPLTIFGTDYATPDGTCVRDYVHVVDLARAHIVAMERLIGGDVGAAYNVGTGVGTSVREVLEAVGAAAGVAVPVVEGERRAGDADAVWADVSRIRAELGWGAEFGLGEIVGGAGAWVGGHA